MCYMYLDVFRIKSVPPGTSPLVLGTARTGCGKIHRLVEVRFSHLN
jgi:hypothetical protein